MMADIFIKVDKSKINFKGEKLFYLDININKGVLPNNIYTDILTRYKNYILMIQI
jgi:hypothetical protein